METLTEALETQQNIQNAIDTIDTTVKGLFEATTELQNNAVKLVNFSNIATVMVEKIMELQCNLKNNENVSLADKTLQLSAIADYTNMALVSLHNADIILNR